MTGRREFVKQLTTAGIACSFPSVLFAGQKTASAMIWADLIHLSYNFWGENVLHPKYGDKHFKCTTCAQAREWAHSYRPELTFDEPVWNMLLDQMASVGMNMVVIDLGDGVRYESHPEIAVKNAWTVKKLKSELDRVRELGLEPIPKLNFSTAHDLWLGKYSRMVSTDIYYHVCRDLIDEVIDIFGKPRFFHLGMDEENAHDQSQFNYTVIRQNDLWWNDFYFFVDQVEKRGVQAWIWSDYAWHHPDLFFKKMPKSVIQSNWYYGSSFDPDTLKEPYKTSVQLYNKLEEYGYEQIPTGSNHSSPDNFGRTVEYCKKVVDPSRLIGFMTASWRPTLQECLNTHREAIGQVENAIKNYQ